MNKNITVIFEDKDIVVLSKPAGMVTNSAATVKEESLQSWFAKNYPQDFPEDWEEMIPSDFSDEYGTPEEIYEQRHGMVHRLDKNTSGVMIFARHPGSLVNLLSQFRLRKTQKEYLALVHGRFGVPEGNILAPLARARVDRKKFAVDINGRQAETKYEVADVFSGFIDDSFSSFSEDNKKLMKQAQRFYNQGFSLVRCWPKTGRTHQIRVHMAHENHPLVGDVIYLGKKRSKVDPLWCERHFLHAESLEFDHPRTGERTKFSAELPADLKKVVSLLEKK
jgi:23S rRNA pseudouridine1911/1915/1917 synthase